MNLLSHLKPTFPLVPCLQIQNLPYCLYQENRSHPGHNDFIPAAFPPHITSSRHSGQLVWRNLHFFFFFWHGSIHMLICSLQPHLLPSPFLFCLYRTIRAPSFFIHSLHFGPLKLVFFGIQDSAQALSPVRSMFFPTISDASQFSVHYGGLVWLLLRLPNFALNICRFYLS